MRYYFVVDMKSFYASCECVLRGKDAIKTNLVVADKNRSKNSICLAVSVALKKLGVKNRCRLCEIPTNLNYIIAKPRMKKYIEYAGKIYDIYLNYFDKNDIHIYSIDECFIDVTSYLKLYSISQQELAKKLIDEIWQKLKIPATAGIGTNLFLAKVALDILAKNSQSGVAELDEKSFKQKLWHHMPITDFWQISTGISKRLEKMGIVDMWGIANYYEEKLYKEFGINAELLIDHANGRESCLMQDIKKYKAKEKSISSGQTLPKNYSFSDAKIVMVEMLEELSSSLYKQNLVTNSITIFVVFAGYKDTQKGHKKIPITTNLFSQILPYADRIFCDIVPKSRFVRKIVITFSNLKPMNFEQYNFFVDNKKIEKEKKITNAVLELKEKFGKNAILKAVSLTKNATQKTRNTQIGGHNAE